MSGDFFASERKNRIGGGTWGVEPTSPVATANFSEFFDFSHSPTENMALKNIIKPKRSWELKPSQSPYGVPPSDVVRLSKPSVGIGSQRLVNFRRPTLLIKSLMSVGGMDSRGSRNRSSTMRCFAEVRRGHGLWSGGGEEKCQFCAIFGRKLAAFQPTARKVHMF